MRTRRWLLIALLCVSSALLFPLGVGVVEGAFASTDELDRLSQAAVLLDDYWAYSPPVIRMASIDSDYDIRRCGYPADLFNSRDIGITDRWTPRNGYWELVLWRIGEEREERDQLRAEYLRSQTSAFSAEFLRVCIRQSVFAPACASYVREVLARAGWDDYVEMPAGPPVRGREMRNRMICSYLDGYAAQTGRSVVQRPAP